MKFLNTTIAKLILIFALTFSFVQVKAINGVEISSYSPVIPVLKGVEINQLLRLRIYVPAGEKDITIKKISSRLNVDGIKSIQAIDIYFTDQEANFSRENKLITLTPSATRADFDINLTIKPGIHYIWFTANLKESADIDTKIDFSVKGLEDDQSKKYAVKQQSENYVKRLGVAVKKAQDGGVNTFRIPGIATTDKGTLIAVYDIRYKNSGDLPGNIDVGMSRSVDGGKTWGTMKVIMDMGEPNENNGVGDPAVLFDPITNKIWVAALWSKGNRSIRGSKPGLSEDITGQLVLVSSDDDGLNWSQPKSITAETKNPIWNIFFNGPGSGIAMKDGTLVFAAQYWDEKAVPYSTLVYSKDHGKSWKTENGPKSNTTESQIIETSPGILMLNMRDNRGSFRSVATTADFGKNWVEHHTSYQDLPDPVCMASFVKASVMVKGKQKEVVFFGNDNTQSGRYNLTIKASMDLGESWNKKHELMVDERNLFGYSSLTKIDDKTIGFFYEGVRDLYFVRIPVSEILK